MLFAQFDWLLYLGISGTIHPRGKQDGVQLCFRQGRTFFNKRSCRARQHQKSNEIWKLSIQRYVFLLFFSDKCAQDVWKCFVYKWWVGDKPTSRKIVKISKNVCENDFTTIHLHFGEKLLFTRCPHVREKNFVPKVFRYLSHCLILPGQYSYIWG